MSALLRGLAAALIGSLALALADCTPDMTSRGTSGLFDMAAPPPPSPAPKTSSVPPPKPVPVPKTTEQDAGTWKHVPEPVSAQQFSQDKANCTRIGNSAPGEGSPEMKFFIVYTKCMRSSGYEPN
jgi:hypothetical protein